MIPLPTPQKFLSRLESIEKISSKVYLERFELIEPKEISFSSGQTVMLYVAPACAGRPAANRAMSIASPPSEKTSITLIHDVSPMGPYSRWALSAKIGDPMEFMGPLGAFILDRGSDRKKVFVATGTGIAPFHSMIFNEPFSDPCVLYWGLRHEEDIFWQKELEEFCSSHPNFQFVLTLSKPTALWQESASRRKGHVGDYLFTDIKDLPGTDFYLCGNKTMIGDMRAKLKVANVPDIQVKFELFY